LEFIWLFNRRLGKNIHKYLKIEHFQCAEIEILQEGKHDVHADTEYIGKSPAKMKISPKCLKVIV